MEQKNEFSDYVNKNQFVLSIIFMIVIMISLFLSVFILLNNRLDKAISNFSVDAPTFNEVVEENDNKNQNSTYLIIEDKGKLAVYKDGSFEYIVDIHVSTLPENDRKLLSEGIEVTSEQELNEIISSYY